MVRFSLALLRPGHRRCSMPGELRCRRYGDAISAHTATRGLFTGIGLRHVADRSVGMIARFRLGPQYAVKSISFSPHCTRQAVSSQFERTIRMPDVVLGGPASPCGPWGPGGPGSPIGPFELGPQIISEPATAMIVSIATTYMALIGDAARTARATSSPLGDTAWTARAKSSPLGVMPLFSVSSHAAESCVSSLLSGPIARGMNTSCRT